jgi:DNA-binding transcriptional ArsR family regulator
MATSTQQQRQAAFERQADRARALGHPLRFRMIAILIEREASPAELAEELGESLRKVCYHIEYLRGDLSHSPEPLIELVGTDQRKGGTIHVYRAIERHRIDMATAAKHSQPVREDASSVAIDRIVSDLLGAQQEGTLDSHPQRSLMRVHGLVDDKGMHELAELVEGYVTAVEGIMDESKGRLSETGEKAIPVASETLVFPVARVY